jgi:hypothetical protein
MMIIILRALSVVLEPCKERVNPPLTLATVASRVVNLDNHHVAQAILFFSGDDLQEEYRYILLLGGQGRRLSRLRGPNVLAGNVESHPRETVVLSDSRNCRWCGCWLLR